ncbi:EAL domain-containing protein [Thiocystis violascens]|uniref:Diguanylate cyclase (GGDEF) domain-containing protein n=1 Tax=Thiocystis violascens (strain ATCC 17096 / DSM 198 / 6111) TaxID=765911 RepID=I3YBW9_THIV6|nr:EAL domain-containing protein [Thiocystis violascens]AFL74487.1 diguanylate cyclase (GGDEF) domain-containing protein [Thiocystis violascens DSM 198]
MTDAIGMSMEDAQMRHASHDPVTGLPGLPLIRDRLANALQRSRRNGLSLVVLFVDLDGFNLVKHTDGHDIGDRLLKKVAERLAEQIRPGDTLARFANEEFLILCEQIEQPATLSVLADRINEALRQPLECDGRQRIVTASVGLAIGNGNTHCVDDLLSHAETAMSAVKEGGGDGWRFFSPSQHDLDQQRLAIVNGLRTAIERNELSTRFQPIVVAESGRIVGAELLLRWNSSEGEISPAVFVPIAEMTGAIVPIGAWVFRQACLAEADWRRRWGSEAPYVSVNVSPRQLSKESLVEEFAAILRETGADPARLVLEITETALMADVELNLRLLRRLTELGLRVAVDDFGTGYSSLAQLTRLPVAVLKIDRAFVDGIDKRPENRAVIRAVIGLGRALGLKLVAEGVETDAQRRELRAYGCEFAQGYYFHRPLAEPVFVDTLERDRHGGDAPDAAAPLYFLIYVSQAMPPMSGATLDALRKQSNTYNRSTGLTGCLLYQDGLFMQMLEGQREVVSALMDEVKADPRHRDVRIVIEGPARQRVFLDWGMAVHDLTPGANEPDFTLWPGRRLSFRDLAEDARTCYIYLTAYAGCGMSKGVGA